MEKTGLYDRKRYYKCKTDNSTMPYFVWQNQYINICTCDNLREILKDAWLDAKKEEEIINKYKDYQKVMGSQIRFSWNHLFIKLVADKVLWAKNWDKFVDNLINVLSEVAKTTATVRDTKWVDKMAPLAIFTQYDYFNSEKLKNGRKGK